MKITRSYSRKKNIGNYQTLDFFCSVEQEIEDTSEMKPTSKMLQEFCIKEVNNDVQDYEFSLEKEKGMVLTNIITNTSEPSKELNFKNVKLDGN